MKTTQSAITHDSRMIGVPPAFSFACVVTRHAKTIQVIFDNLSVERVILLRLRSPASEGSPSLHVIHIHPSMIIPLQ